MRALPILATLSLALVASGCGNADTCADYSPSFKLINRCVLKTSCASFSACHSATGRKGGLDLQTDPYNALVNAPCVNDVAKANGWHLVTPGNEKTSYAFVKLSLPSVQELPDAGAGGPNMGLGNRMPNTGQSLDAPTIAQIQQWIKMGAPNN